MKIRNGFVSNSSSSSFICAVSGGVEAGMDMSISEAGMVGCINGHEFYEQYLINLDEEIITQEKVAFAKRILLEMTQSEWRIKSYPDAVAETVDFLNSFDKLSVKVWLEECEERDVFADYDYSRFPSECPICSLTFIRDKDVLKYLLKETGFKKEVIKESIRKDYLDYSDFKGK